MHMHNLSRKAVKRFGDRILKRLERDGVSVNFPQILEALASAYEVRDWNTLSATLQDDEADKGPKRAKVETGGFTTEIHEWQLTTDVSFSPLYSQSPFRRALMDNQVELVSAPPGKGKSILLNVGNLDFCLAKRPLAVQSRLGIVDIGKSGLGVAKLLIDMLPDERKHEVVSKRLRMTPDMAINPFDTPLGQRLLDKRQSFLLTNLLRLMLSQTPEHDSETIEEMDACRMALRTCYDFWSDTGLSSKPASYTAGKDARVDAALNRVGFTPKTWWEAVDLLFQVGDIQSALWAQRHAVPTLPDLVETLQSHEFVAVFGATTMKLMVRRLNTCIRNYPNLALRTSLELGNARVVVLDINELAPQGNGVPAQQTAIAYMLALHAVSQGIFPGQTIDKVSPVDGLAKAYWEHHRREWTRRAPARLVLDELHRVARFPAMSEQLVFDARESRKWGVNIVLSSQLDSDFTPGLLELAGTVWIGGANTSADINRLVERHRLSSSAHETISRILTGPGPQGKPFFVVRDQEDGRKEEIHTIQLSADVIRLIDFQNEFRTC